MAGGETRHGVPLTNLDQPLFEGADETKRALLDYLDAVGDRLVRVLADRPLSVVRVLRGQAPFVQKNLPRYTPDWVPRVSRWAESSHREVSYALCNDLRTLLWFGNQRAVEYHPALAPASHDGQASHLVLDIDPPHDDAFPAAVRTALLVRQVLAESGLDGAVKTSGAKGLHIFVPMQPGTAAEDAAAATRAIGARAARLDPDLVTTAYLRAERAGRVLVDTSRAGNATVVAAYSPRVRPGVPVSFPVAWDDLDRVRPGERTLRSAPRLLGDTDPWADGMPPPQHLESGLVEEGRRIPVARAQAMHEGRRRARARRR